MVAADLPAVEAIERQGFITPYPANTFIEQLGLPHGRVTVAELEQAGAPTVVGFCNYWLLAGELELLAIGSHAEHRRRGVAHALFAEMAQAAHTAQVTHAFLKFAPAILQRLRCTWATALPTSRSVATTTATARMPW